MSLRDMAALDSAMIVEDVDDFASEIVLIAPDTTRHVLHGLFNRVGVMLDPDTGLKIHGNSSTATVSLASLATEGVTVEMLEQDNWQIEATDITGATVSGLVSAALKDRTLGRVTMSIRTVDNV